MGVAIEAIFDLLGFSVIRRFAGRHREMTSLAGSREVSRRVREETVHMKDVRYVRNRFG